MRRLYASKLTKKDLEAEGITCITEDGRIFKGEKEIFPFWTTNKRPYLGINIYDRDSEGHLIKGKDRIYRYKRADGSIGETITWQGKSRTVGLHRIMWAWHYGEAPEGMVVDHIDNKHETLYDYRLENLQLLTQAENLAKEREDNWGTSTLVCKMNKPRSFYEDKLLAYEKKYEEAKKNHDAEAAHRLRANISHTRARLRYWDQHKEEYEDHITFKEAEEGLRDNWKQNIKDRKLLEQYKQIFKESGNKAMWHQMCKIIKAWDQLDSIQKEHVFEVLHRFFSK